jgi:hypothetical protein
VRLAAQPVTGPVVVMIGRVFSDHLQTAAREPAGEPRGVRLAQ